MPPQISRLLILFAIFIGLFLTARSFLVPDSFGKYGHYRANAITDVQQTAQVYAGTEQCINCHDTIAEKKDEDVHAELACEICHDASLEHVLTSDSVSTDTSKIIINRESSLCWLCHSKNAARKKRVVFQIEFAEHYPEKKCVECHNPHSPWELKEDQTDENL